MKIIYQDSAVIVLHKDPEATTYPEGQGISCLAFLKMQVEGGVFPVHRLDKGTCGLLLFARSPAAANYLQREFKLEKVEKKYQAWVEGEFPAVAKSHAPIEGKKALTEFCRVKVQEFGGQKFSLVEALPQTGRTHQIRIHLSRLGFPIVGDAKYGSRKKAFSGKAERFLLSSVAVSFKHPVSKKTVSYQAKPHPSFRV